MERLTTKMGDMYIDISDNPYSTDRIVEKLGAFEDFMEEQGFESLEDLKNTVKYIENAIKDKSKLENFKEIEKVLNSYFIKNSEDLLNKFHTLEEKIKYANFKKGEYFEENQALKDRWEKLKDYLNNGFDGYPDLGGAWVIKVDDVLDKMEELEKGGK